MKAKDRDGSGGGCGGCLGIVAGLFLLWAVIFGVTIGGVHYDVIDCSVARGVELR